MGLDRFVLKDSGKREQFATGSQRDSGKGKGRIDLVPIECLERLAVIYERGAEKYDDDNWRKGQPLKRMYASLLRHAFAFMKGQEDEDHIIQAAWNCFAMAWTLAAIKRGDLPDVLDDRYRCDTGKPPFGDTREESVH